MPEISQLLENNRKWSERINREQPDYFPILSKQQAPNYLWIGCSDSRVPANEILGLLPGEVFVHRNVANLVHSSDLNCLSVLEYAIHTLKIEHIIVCGHYGCGGVRASLENSSHGLIDNWLTKIRHTYARHHSEIEALPNFEAKADRLCELNVIEQVKSVSQTTIVQEAWARGQKLHIYGWCYGLKNGLINDLGIKISGLAEIPPAYRVV